ncbi:MAG: D-alanine--D-alanine ligase [Phycisphaerae bacterium]
MVKKIIKTAEDTRVTVLAGGPSRERPVSQVSGKAVADALKTAGFKVTLADILPDDLAALDIPGDVIFPVLHGQFGEDGRLQEILEERGLTYCGSGPQACRLAMNKHHSKLKMLELGIPTPKFDIVEKIEDIRKAKCCWSIPVVVKPVEEGSSLGITIVQRAEDLEKVIGQTLEQFGVVMIEEFIDGRELTVGIFADNALPILEIRSNRQFYDYQAKYNDPKTEYTFIKDLPKELYIEVQELSVRAAKGLGLRDFCRVDWRLDANDRPFFLEVNAIPGFTDHSLLPKAAAMAGYDMVNFCKTIVEMALQRKSFGFRVSGFGSNPQPETRNSKPETIFQV